MVREANEEDVIIISDCMHRVCEPEVMSDDEEAKAYAGIDNDKPNRALVEYICREIGHNDGLILDIGCGPGSIALRLAECFPDSLVLGIDLSEAMLKMARELVHRHHSRVTNLEFVLADGKDSKLLPNTASLIVSNSVVHHIHEPLEFFKEVSRLAKPECGLCIRDLRRPINQAELDDLVLRYTVNDTPLQRQLFANSLRAALRREEVATYVAAAGLENCSIDLVGELYWQVTRRTGEALTHAI